MKNETKQSTAKKYLRNEVFFRIWYNVIVKLNTKKRVGVMRGGAGENYASSLKKGGEIIAHIFEHLPEKYKVYDILVDRAGICHINGIPTNPADLAHRVDIVWNTASPSLTQFLNNLSIPVVGNDSFSASLENNPHILREHLQKISLPMPKFIIAPKSAKEVLEKFPAPWIVKNYNEIKVVKTFNELAEAINKTGSLTVEEFIPGKVASVHIVPNFRGENMYTFPLGATYGVFSKEEKERLANLAKTLHTHLGAKHYLKSDFVLTPRSKVYLLQIESAPDLNPDSHFSQVVESVGAKTHHVIEHMLEQAI